MRLGAIWFSATNLAKTQRHFGRSETVVSLLGMSKGLDTFQRILRRPPRKQESARLLISVPEALGVPQAVHPGPCRSQEKGFPMNSEPEAGYVSRELTHFVGRGRREEEQYELLLKIVRSGWLRRIGDVAS